MSDIFNSKAVTALACIGLIFFALGAALSITEGLDQFLVATGLSGLFAWVLLRQRENKNVADAASKPQPAAPAWQPPPVPQNWGEAEVAALHKPPFNDGPHEVFDEKAGVESRTKIMPSGVLLTEEGIAVITTEGTEKRRTYFGVEYYPSEREARDVINDYEDELVESGMGQAEPGDRRKRTMIIVGRENRKSKIMSCIATEDTDPALLKKAGIEI
ncbi:hypothetical protein [Hoyosella subflava]|uniref:Uncharacterized protein n=1 Tax=Hoyosella subflava (strain DSM 45089 / JCM 17490 / NBRC 109087 / DQS3-9A1) TaxID=443218 RepID=F6EF77_HOYSD|nr:hypothetical protein [Hoyosella subflava]AEF38656.1 hypothetical protein AS9A_0196 [Hoyosella subflava DQS3-9A1]